MGAYTLTASDYSGISDQYNIPTDATIVSAPILETIGGGAFYGNTVLTTFDAPVLKTIGDSAFQDSVALTTFNAPLLETIGNSAFRNTALTTFNAPAVTSIGYSAFKNCENISFIFTKVITAFGSSLGMSMRSMVFWHKTGGIDKYVTGGYSGDETWLINADNEWKFDDVPLQYDINSVDDPRTDVHTLNAGGPVLMTVEYTTIDGKTIQRSELKVGDTVVLTATRKVYNSTTYAHTDNGTITTSIPVITTVSHSGGDPYVYPLAGPCYKLPNCADVYRLYQDADIVINARVSAASPEIQAEIVQAVATKGCEFMRPVSTEAFFYSHVLIASRTTDDQVLVDLERKQHTGTVTSSMFRVGVPDVSRGSRPYEDNGASYVEIPIRWGDDSCLSISFSRNPQIRNGVRLSGVGLLVDGTGLLTRNYRAKFFRIPDIYSKAPVSIPNGCARPLTKRGTMGHKELMIKCS